MASTIILSDNGASSGSAGLKQTAGNDGVLILQTTTSGGTATNAIVADNLQNVGVGGISPSTWSTGKAVEVGSAGNTVWGLPADIYLTSNTYYNAGWKYASGNAAGVGIYEINGLTHYWYGASSGSTGASVTLGSKMVMDASTLSLVGLQGIKFQATQSPSSDANTLDDYEEGTFTATISYTGGSSGSFTRTGIYTKIGRQVHINIVIDYDGGAGTTNYLTSVTGLPFTSNMGQSSATGHGLMYNLNSTGTNNISTPGFLIPTGGTLMWLYLGQWGTNEAYVKFANSNGYFQVCATYFA